jgi:hypothetical protein
MAIDLGISYVDLNGDGLINMAQAFYDDVNKKATVNSWLNNGCQFVDTSTISPSNPFVECSIPRNPPNSQVSAFLEDDGLDKYANHFANHEVDFEALLELTDNELKEIGVKAVGARKRILKQINREKSRHPTGELAL